MMNTSDRFTTFAPSSSNTTLPPLPPSMPSPADSPLLLPPLYSSDEAFMMLDEFCALDSNISACNVGSQPMPQPSPEPLNQVPPGFRFCPEDEELILYYLMKKVSNQPLSPPDMNMIFEMDIYKSNPWDLPENLKQGLKKWYFFTQRDRKYPNGHRPNRQAGVGFWKATAKDQPIIYNGRSLYRDTLYGDIIKGDIIGTKRQLNFHIGQPSNGKSTNWIMHEYNLHDRFQIRSNKKGTAADTRLGSWVLCSIYNKSKSTNAEDESNGAIVSIQ